MNNNKVWPRVEEFCVRGFKDNFPDVRPYNYAWIDASRRPS